MRIIIDMKTTTNMGARVGTVASCKLACSHCKGRIAKGETIAWVEVWTVHPECAAAMTRVRVAQGAAAAAEAAAAVTGEAAAEIERAARYYGDAS